MKTAAVAVAALEGQHRHQGVVVVVVAAAVAAAAMPAPTWPQAHPAVAAVVGWRLLRLVLPLPLPLLLLPGAGVTEGEEWCAQRWACEQSAMDWQGSLLPKA